MSEFKKSIIKGSIWSILGRMLSLVVVLITNIWLARLLSPTEFGQVGILMFFVTIASVFTESGLGGALVRKKQATLNDYSTVFVSNLILSVFSFCLIYFSSGFVAEYYDDPLLQDLLIIISLVLIINAFQITQRAKLISEMKFKQIAIYRLAAVFISSAIGIYAAYQGMGVWALVLIQLLTAGIYTISLWILEGVFIKLYFSKSSFRELYRFGMNTTFASLLNTGFDNIYQLILARYFSLAQTGYFYQAKKIQDVPGGVINMVTQSVVFSALAKLQDDKLAFTKTYNKITLYFLVILGFTSVFIYVYAEPIILLLYGEKWLGAVFYMQLLTIASFFYIQEMINRVIFKVFDQTRQILYLEYFKKGIQAISIGIGVYFLDLDILIVGFVITNIVGYLINYYYSRKIIGAVSGYEFIILVKVCILSLIVGIITMFTSKTLNLVGYRQLFTIPVMFIIYTIGIQVLRIGNIKKEVDDILKLYRNND